MCPHANTTTIAFSYGEAPLEHAAHVAGCPECAAVVEAHEQVVSALGPALGAIRPPRAAPPPRTAWRWAAVAVAAAVIAVVCTTGGPGRPAPRDADAGLDAVELEIVALGWEE